MSVVTRIIILAGTFIILSTIQHFIYKYKCVKEGMENGKESPIKNVYLIGDSIIKNDLYVTSGRSVEYHINAILKSDKKGPSVTNLAIDNSCINDIYEQLRFIPVGSRDNNVIFLSVGGNDILKKYVYMYNTDFVGLSNLFKKYKDLVERIKTQFPEHKLVLMNIYYPPNKQLFSPFYPLIKEWNKSIDGYIGNDNGDTIGNDNGDTIGLIRIDEIMIENADFIDNIEPSESGGKKIAKLIANIL